MVDGDDAACNPSPNPTLADVLGARISRRGLLRGGLAAAAVSFLGPGGPALPVRGKARSAAPGDLLPEPERSAAGGLLGFEPLAWPTAADGRVPNVDELLVATGYQAAVLVAWGDPIHGADPAFRQDAANSAADQERQWGSHNDGMHLFTIPAGTAGARWGLLVANHEYTDEGLLHVDGFDPWTAEKVAKSQAAHGVSVVELRRLGDRWEIQRPSPFTRRITARTPCRVSGPARGHAWMQTAADPSGTTVLGTFNNCAMGHTPWGTYLTCEENFNNYFVNTDDPAANAQSSLQGRYGITATSSYRWNEHDLRFDAKANPNEPNRFGWVVEIGPFDPTSEPVKRTALGRFKHEGATCTEAADGRVVVYMGDDQVHEYIYKFVSEQSWQQMRLEQKSPLDHGTLYVARFLPGDTAGDGRGLGEWTPLVAGGAGLESLATQAEVVVGARNAADLAGATKMDRPEWIAVHPRSGEVYVSLTNNARRTAPNEPNPRANNVYGQIVRWREAGGDAAATTFEWDLFLLAGDPTKPLQGANPAPTVADDDRFGSPDGLWFDPDGRLWIETDASAANMATPDYDRMPNNQLLAADPATGELRRFLIGPRNCEITGITAAPDGRTLFVGIQHPGEAPTEVNDPANPTRFSTWPDGAGAGRPRSAVVMITKQDGGPIGT